MNTTIKTTSENQINQIRRFAKKSNLNYTLTQQEGIYQITLSGLNSSDMEKFIKSFIKTNGLTKAKPQEQEKEKEQGQSENGGEEI